MTANWYEAPCARVSAEHAERAQARQAVLTKPAGSLGRLEQLAVELAGLQATDKPRAGRAPIVVFAGDHGVTVRGVSAYPSAVTVEMLRNFANGGAAISVLARELGFRLTVIDAGTLATEPVTGVVTDKPSRGTADFTSGPAMSRAEFAHALGCGQRATAASVDAGADLLILGEMGIGNTTAAAAIAAALTRTSARTDRRRRHGCGRRRPGTQGRRDSRGAGAPSFPDAAPRRRPMLGGGRRARDRRARGCHDRCGAGGRARARRRFHRLRRSACGGQDQPERRAVADLLAPLGRARSRAGARRSFGAASARSVVAPG